MSFNLWAGDLYVSPTGNNQNSGLTKDAPFLTILKASQVATPGTIVHVAPGRYEGGFQTKSNGRADAPIVYVSDSKWKAVIVPPARSTREMGWDNRGHFVTIQNFMVDGAVNPTSGPLWTVGINVGGEGNKVVGCNVKNIYLNGSADSGGGAGILLDSWYGFNDMHALNNVVSNIGPDSHYYQGIYMTSTGSIKNNLVYNVRKGAGIHLWHDARKVDIINNTTVGNGNGIVLGGGDFIRAQPLEADYFNVQNNIVYGNTYGINQQGKNGKNNVYKNNLVFMNTYNFYKDFLTGKATHSGTISLDPKFVKYALTDAGDFSLQKDSPAIDKGLRDALTPAADINGLKRPQGQGVDLGAFEYVPTIVAAPIASISLASISFPATTVGKVSASQALTISSMGNAPLILSSIKVSNADFVISGGTCSLSKSYAPGDKCTVLVSFSPKLVGARSAVVAIDSNAAPLRVSLSGSGLAVVQLKPAISISMKSINFGDIRVNRSSAPRTITVTNTGTAPLVFNQYFKFSGPFNFGGSGTCALNVQYAPGKSCTASMVFSPKVRGQQSGSLSIQSNAPAASVVLTGRGIR